MKKILCALIPVLLFTMTLSQSLMPVYANEDIIVSNLNTSKFEFGNDEYEVNVISQNEDRVKMTIKSEDNVEQLEVDYNTGTFTIENENGEIETYNSNDFIVDDAQSKKEIIRYEQEHKAISESSENHNQLSTREETLITPFGLNHNPSSSYIPDIKKALGLSSSVTWSLDYKYPRGSETVYAYRGSETKSVKILKKFSWNTGTTISVVIGALTAYIPAVGVSTLTSFLTSVGATIVAGTLGNSLSLFIGTQERITGRGFYIYNKGYTTSTLSYYNYVYGNSDSGTSKQELYDSGGYAYFYNDWDNSKVADVAYQQYRFIAGLRTTPPKYTEF